MVKFDVKNIKRPIIWNGPSRMEGEYYTVEMQDHACTTRGDSVDCRFSFSPSLACAEPFFQFTLPLDHSIIAHISPFLSHACTDNICSFVLESRLLFSSMIDTFMYVNVPSIRRSIPFAPIKMKKVAAETEQVLVRLSPRPLRTGEVNDGASL